MWVKEHLFRSSLFQEIGLVPGEDSIREAEQNMLKKFAWVLTTTSSMSEILQKMGLEIVPRKQDMSMSGKRIDSPYKPPKSEVKGDTLVCKYCGTQFPIELHGGLELDCLNCGAHVAVQRIVKHQYIFRWGHSPLTI